MSLRDSAVLLFLLYLIRPALALLQIGGTFHIVLLEVGCLLSYLLVAVSAAGRLIGNVIARKVATI